MCRRRTAPPRRRLAQGFTLIEVLVVLAILGIAAGLVYASYERDTRRDLEVEARRLALALEQASAVAQWRGVTIGVSAETHHYRFWERTADDRWLPVLQDERLAPRALPDGMTTRPLSFANTPVGPDAILPLRAGGHNDPFALELASDRWQATVTGDPLDRVSYAIALRALPAP